MSTDIFGGAFAMTGVIIGVTLLITLASLAFAGFFIWKVMAKSMQNRKLLQTGTPAEATILQLQDTGTLVNNNPQVRILMEVRPHGYPPYHAESTTIISYLAIPRVQPGMVVRVRYDPQNPQNVAIEI